MMQWEVVIGLETHVQLSTQSKIFSRSSTAFGAAPNTQASMIDLALPGTLPAMNYAAVDKAIAFGLAVNAQINQQSIFARKNYFYPDLPKNYQISQMDHPILLGGEISFLVGEEQKTIRLTRAHLEEDAGKSIHGILGADSNHKYTGIDLNRAGTPLLEIVTEPDMRSAAEAVGYAKALHSLVVWLGICDGNMQEGSFRVDVNISVRPKGQAAYGTRAEVKNINSFRFIERAIHVEVQRQIECLEDGGTLVQETRLYDPDKDETRSMRSKEDAHDYRYFPDPDLPPLIIHPDWIERVRSELPELPQVRSQRYMQAFNLTQYDAQVLTSSKSTADYFENVAEHLPKEHVKLAANWVMGELASVLNREELDIQASKVSALRLAHLILRIIDGTLSNKTAREVFSVLWSEGGEVDAIIEQKGLKQINDAGAILAIIDEVLLQNESIVNEYKSGKEKVFGSLVGLIMKQAKGKANPQQVNALLKERLMQ